MDAEHVEVAHEALFRSWERLKAWILATQDDLILLRQVRAAATDWARKGQPDYLRWNHERLELVAAMREHLNPILSETELDFIEPEAHRLLRELENIETTHERRRDIGDRLAVIGDPRPGVGVKDGLPDIVWLPISSGGEIEIREQKFKVQPFYIAKYLITYIQYNAFVDAPDGYKNSQWWKDFPEEYNPQELDEQATKSYNNPRDTLSWYQCVAFARWLNHRLKGVTLPSSNMDSQPFTLGENAEIRLPTEWEWQWAAQGGVEKREYPWGQWSEGKSNTSEPGMSRAVSVGLYPNGDAVYGVSDMAGNLWEWCQNEYLDSNNLHGYNNSKGKVLRGGSFSNGRASVTCHFRDGRVPGMDLNLFGCRLVITTIPTSI